jgi:hypothetical protein
MFIAVAILPTLLLSPSLSSPLAIAVFIIASRHPVVIIAPRNRRLIIASCHHRLYHYISPTSSSPMTFFLRNAQ